MGSAKQLEVGLVSYVVEFIYISKPKAVLAIPVKTVGYFSLVI